jgi:transposase-like protein
MQRKRFSREFKLETVKLVRERGVAVAKAEHGRMPPHQMLLDALCQNYVQ